MGLGKIFHCEKFEAEYYYYNNALRLVKEKAVKQNIQDRIISKKELSLSKGAALFLLY